jgi:uncharacterized protein YdhG (YjbR/CyaY superfamily)
MSADIASKPKEARAALKGVRKAIRAAVPQAEEGLSYQIPTYTLNGVPEARDIVARTARKPRSRR